MSDPKAKTPQASYVKVAECLYRNSSSETYYALVKTNGKQIRRSLRTQDRKLAERRLKEFRDQAARLSTSTEGRGLTFTELAQRWFATADLKPSSVDRIQRCLIKPEPSLLARPRSMGSLGRIARPGLSIVPRGFR